MYGLNPSSRPNDKAYFLLKEEDTLNFLKFFSIKRAQITSGAHSFNIVTEANEKQRDLSDLCNFSLKCLG